MKTKLQLNYVDDVLCSLTVS